MATQSPQQLPRGRGGVEEGGGGGLEGERERVDAGSTQTIHLGGRGWWDPQGGWHENLGQLRYLHLQRRGYLEPAAVQYNRQRLFAFRIASKYSPRKIHCTHKFCVLIYTSASRVHEHHCSNCMLCIKVASLNILNQIIVSISEVLIRGETAR